MVNPCKDCNDRQAECHARCSAYISWKKGHDRELREKKRQRHIEAYLNDPHRTNITDAW